MDKHQSRWVDKVEDSDRLDKVDLVLKASVKTGSIDRPSTRKSFSERSSAMPASKPVDSRTFQSHSLASAEHKKS